MVVLLHGLALVLVLEPKGSVLYDFVLLLLLGLGGHLQSTKYTNI